MSSTLLGTLGVKLSALTAQFEKDMEQAKEKLQEIADVSKDVAKVSGVAFAVMSVAIGKMVSAASDAEESMNVVNVAFGASADVVLSWATITARAVGRSEQLLIDFASTTQAMLAPMIGSQDAAAGMSTSLTQLAVDLGSFFNVADPEAMAAIRSALVGSSEPMRKFGVVMTEATLAAFALDRGIKATFKDLDEGSKVALRYQFIMEQTKLAQGDAEKTADSFANAMKGVQGAVNDLLRDFGRALLPVFADFAVAVREALQRVKELSPETKAFASRALLVAAAVAGIVAVLATMLAVLPSVLGFFSALAGGAVIAGSAIASAFLPVTIVLAVIVAAILGVLFTIGTLKKAWDKNLFGMRDTLKSFMKDIKAGWEFLRDGFIKALKSMKTVGEKILAAIGESIEEFVNAHIGILRKLGEALDIETLAGLEDIDIDLTFEDVEGAAAGLNDAIMDGMKAGADFTLDSIAEGFGVAKELLKPLFDAFKGSVDDLGDIPGFAPPPPPGTPSGAPTEAAEVRDVEAVQAEADASLAAATKGLGAFGRIIETLVTKGPIAAIIAVIAEALATTATFGKIIIKFGQFLVNVGRAIEPILAAIYPLLDATFNLAGAFVQLFVKFNPFFAVLILLAPLILKFAQFLDWQLRALIRAFNWVINVIAGVLGAIPVIGDDLKAIAEQFLIDIDPGALSPDLSGNVVDLGDEAGDAADNMADFNDTLRDVNEELSNIPEGFKVAAARFRALDEELGTASTIGGASVAGVAAGSIGTLIESVVIQALDPDDAWQQLKGAADRDNFLTGGTVIGKTSRLAVEGKGGF